MSNNIHTQISALRSITTQEESRTEHTSNNTAQDASTRQVANQVLQNNQASPPTTLPRPIGPPPQANNLIALTIQQLIPLWQQGQNRAETLRTVTALVLPLPTDQYASIQQTLGQGHPTLLHEIEQMKILQNGLSAAITAYDRDVTRFRANPRAPFSPEITTWLNTVTAERVAALPAQLLMQLLRSPLNAYLTSLFAIDEAYKNQDIAAIEKLKKKYFSSSPGETKRYKTWLAQRSDPLVVAGIQYYTQISAQCSNIADTYSRRTSLSIKESKDIFTLLPESIHPTASTLRSFLRTRLALENYNAEQIFKAIISMPDIKEFIKTNRDTTLSPAVAAFRAQLSLSISSGIYNVLWTPEDVAFFERHYGIPHWDTFCFLGCSFCVLQEEFHQRNCIASCLTHCLNIDNTTFNRLINYTQEPLRTCIEVTTHYKNYYSDIRNLAQLLTTFEQPSTQSTDTHTSHIRQCHALIHTITVRGQRILPSTAFRKMVKESIRLEYSQIRVETQFRQFHIADGIIKFKDLLTQLQSHVNEDARIEWTCGLAGECVRAEYLGSLISVRNHLAVLYPDLSTTLNSIILTPEFQHARILHHFNFERVDTILDFHNTVKQYSTSQSNTLFTQLKQHTPDNYCDRAMTDINVFRQIHLLQNAPLDPASRTAIVTELQCFLNTIKPLHHFADIIDTLSKAPETNQEAQNLLKSCLEAIMECACQRLTSQDSHIRNRSLFEIGHILSLSSKTPLRAEFLAYLRSNYPAFKEREWQRECLRRFIQFAERENLSQKATDLLELQNMARSMQLDQYRTFIDELSPDIPRLKQYYLSEDDIEEEDDDRFSQEVFSEFTNFIPYAAHIERLDMLGTTPNDHTARMQCLDAIRAIASQGWKTIHMIKEILLQSEEGRTLLRNTFTAHMEIYYRDLHEAGSNEGNKTTCMIKLAECLGWARELEEIALEGEAPIVLKASLEAIAERYPSTIPLSEICSCAYLLRLHKCQTQLTTAPEAERPRIRRLQLKMWKGLQGTHEASQYRDCMNRLRSCKPEIRPLFDAIGRGELFCNILCALSPDHYTRVRLDDVIPPLPSNANTVFGDGLTNLFDTIPFNELQPQLENTAMTQEAALTATATYSTNVINLAPITGAPNPQTKPAEAHQFWGEVKGRMIHILAHLTDAERRAAELPHNTVEAATTRSKALRDLKRKKIQLLASIINCVGNCGPRYLGDAIDYHLDIVVGKPRTFETAIARALNDIRENIAKTLSRSSADNGMETHEWLGFLQLVGQSLAIRGASAVRFDDPFRINIRARYQNNPSALLKRFEEQYTPFTIISCIEQEVGPSGRQETRELFQEWCNANIQPPGDWGKSRSQNDWGSNLEIIRDLDTAAVKLRELKALGTSPAPEEIARFLSALTIIKGPNETAEHALLKKYNVQLQSGETAEEAIQKAQAALQKETYIGWFFYKVPRTEWTESNKQEHWKVKRQGIINCLVRLGILTSL